MNLHLEFKEEREQGKLIADYFAAISGMLSDIVLK